jgi:hypothetical protein
MGAGGIGRTGALGKSRRNRVYSALQNSKEAKFGENEGLVDILLWLNCMK